MSIYRKEKDYSESKINYQKFLRMLGMKELEIYFQNLAYEVGSAGNMRNSKKIEISQLYYNAAEHNDMLKEVGKNLSLTQLFRTKSESEILIFINELITNKHIYPSISKPLKSFTAMTERQAYAVSTVIVQATHTEGENKYIDYETGQFKAVKRAWTVEEINAQTHMPKNKVLPFKKD